MKYVWIISVVLLSSLNLSGNDLPITLLGGKHSVTIPFDFVAGYTVVNVSINDRPPISLVFDTGAQHTLFFDPGYAETLGVRLSDTITVMGSDMSNQMDAYVCRETHLQLDGAQGVHHDVLFLDRRIDLLDHAIGRPIQGILGISFFGNLAVKIDYLKGRITLIDPNHITRYTKQYQSKHPLTLIESRPHINYTKSDGTSGLALLDTGASLAYSSFITSENQLPTSWIPSVLGQGLGGKLYGYLGIEPEIQIFDTPFTKVISRYQITNQIEQSALPILAQRDALIGNTLLSQFDFTLDLLNQEIYTKPNRKYKKETRYNKSGLQLLAYGYKFHKIYVHAVDIRSPAFLADFREGDYIVSCNLIRGRLLTLNRLYRIFSQASDKTLRIKVLRDGEILTKEITLAPYLG